MSRVKIFGESLPYQPHSFMLLWMPLFYTLLHDLKRAYNHEDTNRSPYIQSEMGIVTAFPVCPIWFDSFQNVYRDFFRQILKY